VEFNPSKRVRFLTKFYMLSESNSDCCVNFKIFIGNDLMEGSDKSVSESVLLELAESLLDKGYNLYLNNGYSSSKLYVELHEKMKRFRDCKK
jgi:hypothetical protein